MPKFHQIIEQHWQHPKPWLTFFLKPFSCVFARIAAKRRRDFLAGRTKSEKLPVPVVVVGNIHAGGAGKTPIVSALVSGLQQRGVNVGIISRGYGRAEKGVHVLNPSTTAAQAGDEPLLLYRQTGAPVAVGSSRAQAGQALLAAYPDVQMIVADDGLQHYALQRNVEIVVFPLADTVRDDLDLLPNGCLREPLSRLASVDAVVVGGGSHPSFRPSGNMFASRVEPGSIYRLSQPDEKLDLGCLKNCRTAAAAGIAKPERFFDSLRRLGVGLDEKLVLPDHADITPQDLPAADFVFVTEKDAVKLSDGPDADALNHVWVLPICAIIEPDLANFVLGRLNIESQRETV
ncbi:tetraacyldisaccharide 4'-kinase [Neisseria iguanae]|uniref:Tetraacyldisaccharide 4'-kinase n=1 Tax=Neisseria iguanae TaxID=90242 RepID=A0A2P7U129_9NEIS|nr:tetraacyldisaccharide 4'-kinase [Neisseria iguanae]PSJ80645.1 tetraacyldisaccharide 4'-kinase [Neisseria iguanae]